MINLFRFFGSKPIAMLATALLLTFLPSTTLAAVSGEAGFVLNSFAFLIWGALVMWMCAGFMMLEAGSVRTKNASVICLKNIGLYAFAGLAYFILGYNLMYVDVGNWFGTFTFFYDTGEAEVALLNLAEDASPAAKQAALTEVVENGHATMSRWFFQMVFVATTASIVSGTLAERVKLWSFFIFIILLTGLIYPVVGAWTWGGGWANQWGFKDFAGSTIVHSTGGWAALAGALVLGARKAKFRDDGSVRQTPPSNVPMVTLGVFILWLGWFGFNGGSQLVMNSAVDMVAVSNILANTNLAAAAGVVAAMCVSRPIMGHVDLHAILNGAIGGLVSITAGPDLITHEWAIVVGAVGGVVVVAGAKLLDMLKIDDVVGAVPAHLFAGIWGTMAVAIFGDGNFLVQLAGILAIGVYVFVVSGILWFAIDRLVGLRVSEETEALGQDVAELGIEAYPEFVLLPENHDD